MSNTISAEPNRNDSIAVGINMNDTTSFNAYLLVAVQKYFQNKTENAKAFLTQYKKPIILSLSIISTSAFIGSLCTYGILNLVLYLHTINDSSYNGDNLNHSILIEDDHNDPYIGPCHWEKQNGKDRCFVNPVINKTLYDIASDTYLKAWFSLFPAILVPLLLLMYICMSSTDSSTDDNQPQSNNRHRIYSQDQSRIYSQDQSHNYGSINPTGCNQESADNQLPPSYTSVVGCVA